MTSRVIPIILILASLGLFFGYINPTYAGKIAALDTEIQSYNGALRAAERFTEREQELLLAREALPDDGLARLDSFLPDGVDNVQLILDLDALADRSGLQLSNFDVTASTLDEEESDELSLGAESPVSSLDLSVSATGTYGAFKTFMKGTEWSLRPLDLVALDIRDSQTGVYTFSMVFRIYWLR